MGKTVLYTIVDSAGMHDGLLHVPILIGHIVQRHNEPRQDGQSNLRHTTHLQTIPISAGSVCNHNWNLEEVHHFA